MSIYTLIENQTNINDWHYHSKYKLFLSLDTCIYYFPKNQSCEMTRWCMLQFSLYFETINLIFNHDVWMKVIKILLFTFQIVVFCYLNQNLSARRILCLKRICLDFRSQYYSFSSDVYSLNVTGLLERLAISPIQNK